MSDFDRDESGCRRGINNATCTASRWVGAIDRSGSDPTVHGQWVDANLLGELPLVEPGVPELTNELIDLGLVAAPARALDVMHPSPSPGLHRIGNHVDHRTLTDKQFPNHPSGTEAGFLWPESSRVGVESASTADSKLGVGKTLLSKIAVPRPSVRNRILILANRFFDVRLPMLNFFLVGLLAIPFSASATVTGTLLIDSAPSNARFTFRQIDADQKDVREAVSGTTLGTLKNFRIRKGQQVRLEITREDHATVVQTLPYETFEAKREKQGTIRLDIKLDPIRESIPVRLSGVGDPKFSIKEQPVPTETMLEFTRESGKTPWRPVVVHAKKDGYEGRTKSLSREEVIAAVLVDGRRSLVIDLEPLLERQTLEIVCNEPGILATVGTNHYDLSKVGGNNGRRLKVNLVFQRASSTAAWSVQKVRLEKSGYEWQEGQSEPLASFEIDLRREDISAMKGKLDALFFKPQKYVPSPIHTFLSDNSKSSLIVSNELASVTAAEAGGRGPDVIFQPASDQVALLASRLTVPRGMKRVYFAMANYEHGTTGLLELKGSTIHYSDDGAIPIQLTGSPEKFDTDPCVSPDGKEVFFSGIENGVRCIKKIPASGGIPFPVTENPRYIDTEPTVSASGRLAFTRRSVGAPPTRPPAVYVQAEDNGELRPLFGELRAGSMPSWSPDGRTIAFVDPANRLCIIQPDGRNFRPISDVGRHANPGWDPQGKIIFVAAEGAVNERGRKHFDIFRVLVSEENGVPARPVPLTSNGSFDFSPACGGGGEILYFLSNRGASKPGQQSLAIYRMVAGEDSSQAPK